MTDLTGTVLPRYLLKTQVRIHQLEEMTQPFIWWFFSDVTQGFLPKPHFPIENKASWMWTIVLTNDSTASSAIAALGTIWKGFRIKLERKKVLIVESQTFLPLIFRASLEVSFSVRESRSHLFCFQNITILSSSGISQGHVYLRYISDIYIRFIWCISQLYLRNISGIFQVYLKYVTCISKVYLRYVPVLSHAYLRYISGIF